MLPIALSFINPAFPDFKFGDLSSRFYRVKGILASLFRYLFYLSYTIRTLALFQYYASLVSPSWVRSESTRDILITNYDDLYYSKKQGRNFGSLFQLIRDVKAQLVCSLQVARWTELKIQLLPAGWLNIICLLTFAEQPKIEAIEKSTTAVFNPLTNHWILYTKN